MHVLAALAPAAENAQICFSREESQGVLNIRPAEITANDKSLFWIAGGERKCARIDPGQYNIIARSSDPYDPNDKKPSSWMSKPLAISLHKNEIVEMTVLPISQGAAFVGPWEIKEKSPNGRIAGRVCTKEEAFQAENDTDNLKDWESVYRSFKRFSHCDNGAIAEGYSVAVGRLLADYWKQFKRLQTLCLKNKEFRRFVIKHIDETLSVEVLQKIIDNARLHCPSNARQLCKNIRAAASAGWNPDQTE